MKKIPVLFCKIDDDDFEKVSQFNWSLGKNGYVRAYTGQGDSQILMHRLVMDFPDSDIDHINRNKTDNRKHNLRIATDSENASNKPPRKGTSKYKGVSWDRVNNKWVAQISFKNFHKRLGRFLKEEDAAKAYNEKAKELHGEFAVLNEVPNES